MKAILLLFILMNYMFASIGTVVSINGEAIIDRNNVMHKVKKNDVIEKNDVIKTFNQTLLKIVLHDKTQISLGENSSLNIKNYLYNEQSKQDNSVELNFFKGTFKTVTGRIGKLNPRKFKLKTKNASIGIRGTIIEGDQNRVACTQGLISVTSAGVTQMVKAGEVTKTMHNKPPSKPTVYKGGVFKKPEKSVALKEKELIEAKVEEPEPTQAEPEPTEPEPMEPEPTEPEPTEPEPIQPEPTEPEPIQPEPTEPEPIAIPFLPFMPDPIVETQNTLGNNDYTTWGTWTISQGNEILDYNHWISGDTTASDDLPGTGTVTYNGSVHGSVYDAGYREIDGTSSVTANFSDNTMSGTLHMKYQDSGSSFVQAHLNDTTITRASSSFSGELVNGATITDGTISGKFYGPNAEEIGGDWELTKDGNRATGIFNGKQ